ncbi:hypothetical protein ACIQJT_13565 [Streptomyces sp. NPDC091972]|uniref:hypothetical protein n=1 Tax=Streptomyces sp. NPDC091972 TaxID=3366007 RepID=UPI003826D4AA
MERLTRHALPIRRFGLIRLIRLIRRILAIPGRWCRRCPDPAAATAGFRVRAPSGAARM